MNKETKLEERMKCMWRQMAESGVSTSFEPVKEYMTDHPLYRCKYNCSGFEFECDGYRVLDSIVQTSLNMKPQEPTLEQQSKQELEYLKEQYSQGIYSFGDYIKRMKLEEQEQLFSQQIDEAFELLHERARNGQHNYNAYAELMTTRRNFEKW